MNAALAAALARAIATVGASSSSLSSASRSESLYEAFTFACVVNAFTILGARFEVRDHLDRQTTAVVFRTKPGLIYSPRFTYVLVELQGAEYEIHTDLRVLGRSKILHELDVCIIDHAEGVRCRQGHLLPRNSKVRLLAECKFYGRTLPLHLGREFLGLSSEFPLRLKTLVSSVGNDNVHTLVTSHKGTENFNVSPANPANVRMFVQWLAKELTQVL